MKLVEHEILRKHILSRLKELNWTDATLIKEMNEAGVPITAGRWSNYRKGKKGGVTDEQLVYVSTRLGIDVHINIGRPVIEGGKLSFEIPEYNEELSKAKLNRILGNG